MLSLTRIWEPSVADGTLGVLSLGQDSRLFSLERPWLDNLPFFSCVPAGEYALVRHWTEDHPDTWALVGETVSHQPDPGKPRSAVLFDIANQASELEGCIALGLRAGFGEDGRMRVVDSKPAMERLRSYLRHESDLQMEIAWGKAHGKRKHASARA